MFCIHRIEVKSQFSYNDPTQRMSSDSSRTEQPSPWLILKLRLYHPLLLILCQYLTSHPRAVRGWTDGVKTALQVKKKATRHKTTSRVTRMRRYRSKQHSFVLLLDYTKKFPYLFSTSCHSFLRPSFVSRFRLLPFPLLVRLLLKCRCLLSPIPISCSLVTPVKFYNLTRGMHNTWIIRPSTDPQCQMLIKHQCQKIPDTWKCCNGLKWLFKPQIPVRLIYASLNHIM
jgi:hypothetical protein